MHLSDEKIFDMIVDIMGIANKQKDIHLLHNWIDEVGIDEAFAKVILIHTTYSTA